MSKSRVILIAVVAIGVGILIGFYAHQSLSSSSANTVTRSSQQDSAADSASRAMTFTQPKAPTR